MVERWPHTFTLTKPNVSIKDAQGNMSDNGDLNTFETIGRAKVAGMGQGTIIAENGDVMPTTHTVTFPWFEDDFANGQILYNGRNYNIIRFEQYQNRCKAWI